MATTPKIEKPTKKELFQMIRDQIQHEDGLINQRLNWLLLSQAFLFAAFSTIITSDKPLNFINLAIQPWIPFGVTIIGMILNLSSFAGLRPAYASLKSLRETWYEANGKSDETKRIQNGFPQVTWVGRRMFERAIATSTTTPWVVFTAWVLLATITFPIRTTVVWLAGIIIWIITTIYMYVSTFRN